MTEILGITASILTVAEAGLKLGQLIRSLRHAPDELLALNNEVVELKVILTQIQLLKDAQPDILINISPTFEKTSESIQSLKSLVDGYHGRLVTGFRRFKWVLETAKINDLKQDIRERRSQLNALFTVNNL